MKRFLGYAALSVLGLLAGASLGFHWGRVSLGQAPKVVSQIYALGEYETLASLQYQQADSSHGKQALLDLLRFMQSVEASVGNAVGKQLRIDRAIVHMRLGLLEESQGDNEGAHDYVRQGLEDINKDSDQPRSEAWLRDAVARQDSRTRYALPTIFLLRQANK